MQANQEHIFFFSTTFDVSVLFYLRNTGYVFDKHFCIIVNISRQDAKYAKIAKFIVRIINIF